MRRRDNPAARKQGSPCHDLALAVDLGVNATSEVGTGQKTIWRRLITIVLGIGAASLVGCTTHSYAPGPGMSATNLGPESAECRLLVRSTRGDTSFGASGSPKFVAIASGIGLLAGAIGTALHDSEAYGDCMEARGYQIADGRPVGPNSTQPVAMRVVSTQPDGITPYEVAPLLAPVSAADAERVTRAARTMRTAEAWLVAERILDRPDSDREKFRLYTSLCRAGDKSACVMTEALAEPFR
jgi:hypothetical protein